jgi:hypothetical protein
MMTEHHVYGVRSDRVDRKVTEAAEALFKACYDAAPQFDPTLIPKGDESRRKTALSFAVQMLGEHYLGDAASYPDRRADLLQVYAQVIGGYMANCGEAGPMVPMALLAMIPEFYERAMGAVGEAAARRDH